MSGSEETSRSGPTDSGTTLSARIRLIWRLFVGDPAVRYSMLSKLAAFGFGPFVILFVGTFLSPDQQGVYYVFGSLLQLRTFVDLGFSQSAQQLLSHAFGSSEALGVERITSEDHILSFSSIGRLVVKIYIWLGLATFLLLGVCGQIYLAKNLVHLPIDWKGPWWLMISSVGLGIGLQGFVSIAEGANLIAQTNKWRFIAEFSGIVTFLSILGGGGGLWASAAFSWMRCLLTAVPIVLVLGRKTISTIMSAKPVGPQHLGRILPLQLRNMVAFGMGFLVFYLYNPMTLSLGGALAAGIVGMSLQISNLVQNFSTVWLNSKIPMMGNFAGAGNEGHLLLLHRKAVRITLASWIGVATVVMVGAAVAKILWPAFGARYAALPAMLCFIAGSLGQTWSHLRASYIRSHQIEPFAPLSIIQGLLTAALLWFLVRWSDVEGAALTFAATMAFSALWVEVVFRRYQKQFSPHSPVVHA